MKKILLFLLFSNFAIAQSIVDIRLVNYNIGCPQFNGTITNTTESNDTGLNIILQAHNVLRYEIKGGHPYPSFSNRMIEVECANCNANQLITALNAYSSVVENSVSSNYGTFKDALTTSILSQGIGIPIGLNGTIIVTNNAGLNQIFEDFNVFYFSLYCPSCTSPSLQRVYNVVCDCDNVLLKTALDNYSSVIEPASTYYSSAGYLLGNSQFDISKTTIYPNPFQDNFNIKATEGISNYTILDISGKQIINANSKMELDNQSLNLNSGVYILKLQYENGQNANYKLLKK